ncbi:MAG TPA: nuclear transport factor 2 family protein [Gillisia sp.]|nr:nuclear transport factor 2 family protein [Gillisia sp.]
MKKFKEHLVLLLLLVSIGTVFSQEKEKLTDQTLLYKTGNPADWPTELDAVIAAPKNHEILLENDKVRVLEVTLAPGEKEALHHHRWPSALYIQEAGDFIDYDGDGNVIFDSRKLPDPLTLPLTMYKDPEAPHSVVNLSQEKTIRLIRVEMKQGNLYQNMAVVDGLYKAFAVGDIPTVLGAMDANIIWNEAEGNVYADGNPYIGPEAVLNGVFARIGADHEYFNLTDIVLHEMSNDQVLATLRYKGKLKENGAVFDAQVAHLWTLKDGKVIAFQQYTDTKQLADSVGK